MRKKLHKAQTQLPEEGDIVDLDMEDLEAFVEKAKTGPLSEQECHKLRCAIETLSSVSNELDKKRVSIQRLKQMLFGDTTEKTDNVFKDKAKPKDDKPKDPAKGHGRNGADDYADAKKTEVKHPELKAGDSCPDCKKGTVYKHKPARIVRISGFAPLQAEVYELEKLRCGTCGKIYTAAAPEGMGDQKYDSRARAIVALLKYGSGMPFNRLEGLQGNFDIPVPASTQWDIVDDSSWDIDPVNRALIHLASQGKIVHNDDTTMKILKSQPQDPDRKGTFTSGIVSILEDNRKIALFFTGHKHAGENLVELLHNRNELLDKPVQMCDALSRNMPEGLKTAAGNCLVHGRRNFVEVANNFPDECLYVFEILKDVYKHDADTKGMTDSQRLAYHQQKSRPKMKELRAWMYKQLKERKVEDNSSLGKAMSYMLKHWKKLTLFLRHPGAPLDNNICERAMKKAILHRKNSYFYKTGNGARVGDLFMSLIHTCELNKVNSFDYIKTLLDNKAAIAEEPAKWLPWNYLDNFKSSAPA